jgi:uncharacterized repeat protein (TIGR03806 family)
MLALLFISCGVLGADAASIHIDADAPFPRRLSEFGLFRDASRQIPNDGLTPYDVITPLFSDYAEKYRFVYLPEGTAIAYREDGTFAFPVGAALIKTFAYPAMDGDGLNLVETRVMIHRERGWEGAAYVWNEEQTDARITIGGTSVDVAWRGASGEARSTKYFVPNMNQCKQCHRAHDVVAPIGFQARHINRDAEIGGERRNQLAYLAARGLIEGAPEPEAAPKATRWDDETAPIAARARAYLDINCAHCHNPQGLASHTQLDLTYTQDDPNHRGIMKRPTSAGRASMDMYFAIKPGDPDRSFLLQRLMSAEPAVRMPQIARTVVHDEGVALIHAWIESLGAGHAAD